VLSRKIIAIAILACFIPHIALADRIVLRSGESVEGTVANREIVAQQPLEQENIAILVESTDGGSELSRFVVADIDYIVLEDDESERVIDFSSLGKTPMSEPTSSAPEVMPSHYSRYDEDTGTGHLLIGLGAVSAGVGALVKFGGERVTVTNSQIDYDEKTYNGLNYALIIGGVALAVIGIVSIGNEKSESNTGVSLDCGPNGRTYVGIGYRF
jgi:hypothetical protein